MLSFGCYVLEDPIRVSWYFKTSAPAGKALLLSHIKDKSDEKLMVTTKSQFSSLVLILKLILLSNRHETVFILRTRLVFE